MESLPTLYEAAQLYGFFCLVTALSIGVINFRLLLMVRPFGFVGSMSYMITTFIVSLIFAPMFFIVLIFFGEVYKDAIFTSLLKQGDNENE